MPGEPVDHRLVRGLGLQVPLRDHARREGCEAPQRAWPRGVGDPAPGVVPSPVTIFFFAKCLPSWPPSPEIRTARAKFTDFLLAVSDYPVALKAGKKASQTVF